MARQDIKVGLIDWSAMVLTSSTSKFAVPVVILAFIPTAAIGATNVLCDELKYNYMVNYFLFLSNSNVLI